MGLRSLPFFKAKKGWQFAGGGLSADGEGGGTLPAFPFPVPDGYKLRLITYPNVTVRPSAWVSLGDIGTAEPYFMFGRGAFKAGEIWCGYIDCKKLSNGELQCRGVNDTTNNYSLTVYSYVIERSE